MEIDKEQDLIIRKIRGSETVGEILECKTMISNFTAKWKKSALSPNYVEKIQLALKKKYTYL